MISLARPAIPRDTAGMPAKMGVDDFVLRHGEKAFRDLVHQALAEEPAARSLKGYRNDMESVRLEALGRPGIYLDRSPPGAGKSYADLAAAKRVQRSLIIVPTHKNCREVAKLFRQHGLMAEAYPALCQETCQNHDAALKAIDAGLAASSAVCPSCAFRTNCEYQDGLATADAADHRMATHQRAAFALSAMARGVGYVAIHEDSLSVLCPTEESLSADGFETVSKAADAAGGRTVDMTLRHYLWRLGEIAHAFSKCLRRG